MTFVKLHIRRSSEIYLEKEVTLRPTFLIVKPEVLLRCLSVNSSQTNRNAANPREFLFLHETLPTRSLVDGIARSSIDPSYLAKGTPADDLERLEILDAEPRPLQPEELSLLLGMLQPLLLLLLLRQALVLERLLELRQPLLPLDVLRYQVAVIVLQRYLQEAKRDALIIIRPYDTPLSPPLPSSLHLPPLPPSPALPVVTSELDVMRSITLYLAHDKTTSGERAAATAGDYYTPRDQVRELVVERHFGAATTGYASRHMDSPERRLRTEIAGTPLRIFPTKLLSRPGQLGLNSN